MQAAFIERTGPPEVIQFGHLPTPEPGPGQIRVKLAAVAVDPIDTYLRARLIAMPLPFPFIVGSDFAGTVDAVGAGVTRFRAGDRVWGSNQGLLGRQGVCAEFAVVHEDFAYPSPPRVADEALAAAALVGITAHLGLLRHARLQRGETIFINGGSGGVGSTVIQLARTLGARVLCSAGSDAKAHACRALGAEAAFNYRTGDVAAALKQAAPEGVQVWWETTREPDFDRAVAALAPGGRFVLMAGREARPPFPVGPFYVKGCSLHGFVMFNASAAEQRKAAEDLARWLGEGVLRPKIDRVLPLAETAAAHRLQEESTVQRSGALAGKIVLKP
ncbi:MAG TPA: NADPH:quinone reductase [Verrucomicrobiota bacterium]|nr:NADPH:quinone reductase [Verrucomicrobiota bacterium]